MINQPFNFLKPKMNFLKLVVGLRNNPNRGSPIDLVYDIEGNYYDPQLLTRVNNLPEPILDTYLIDISKLTSDPVVICTLIDSVILVTDNNTLQILNESSSDGEIEPMVFHMMLRVPNMLLYSGRIDLPNQLEVMRLPTFKNSIWDVLTEYVNIGLSLQSLQISGISPTTRSDNTENLSNSEIIKLRELLLSYETFMKQTYGIPFTLPQFLIVNDVRLDFIPFQQITEMLSEGKIERFEIDPILQPWAGDTKKGYRILTMFGKNGMAYLVKAKYNPITNKIFPP